MRVNKYIAQRLGISRRKADEQITAGKVKINEQIAQAGQTIKDGDVILMNNKPLPEKLKFLTIILNKPAGYVCSKNAQGNNTIYDILPKKYQNLNPVGRLDKQSSGLLLLTNNGQLHQQLTHPKYQKEKIYKVAINQPLEPADKVKIENGIELEDGISKLNLSLWQRDGKRWFVKMHEGRNRQIRRTFNKAGYKVTGLHRIKFGPYELGDLSPGMFIEQTGS